jgi:hypothetical protein
MIVKENILSIFTYQGTKVYTLPQYSAATETKPAPEPEYIDPPEFEEDEFEEDEVEEDRIPF